MLKGNSLIWSKYRLNIVKWIFGMSMSSTFEVKKLRNLLESEAKAWLM